MHPGIDNAIRVKRFDLPTQQKKRPSGVLSRPDQPPIGRNLNLTSMPRVAYDKESLVVTLEDVTLDSGDTVLTTIAARATIHLLGDANPNVQ